ncbi:MAG: FAD-dependent monooxygenase [Acidothermales bacterium]|nr:FAD-dependent monooxygenase [Acidothermales bacterium]
MAITPGSAAPRRPRAVVAGGSIGGLTAALLLRDIGFDVSVYERSRSQLAGRGAGIIAHEVTLRYLVDSGRRLDDLTIEGGLLRYVDETGGTVHEAPSNYRYTSWQALYRGLLELFDERRYHYGHALTAVRQDDQGVDVSLSTGATERCDLLVCADGVSSTARSLLLPEVEPSYAGYVGWRGIIPGADVRQGLLHELRFDITYQLLRAGGHILAYPIPTADGHSDGGDIFLNWVWYRNVPRERFRWLMADHEGTLHSLSLPAPSVRADVLDELNAAAETQLAPALAELVLSTAQPFVQTIVDVEVPRQVLGRVCLLGDAAFVARPHAAAGTAKAAADAWALAEALRKADSLDDGLARWETTQLALGRQLVARTRTLGDGAQFERSWRPGSTDLLFGLWAPGDARFLPR